MSGCPEDRVGEWLLKCAVRRGASHYERDFPEDLPPDNPDLSHEELAVALCLGQHPYNSVFIRAAAQLLSSPRTDAQRLARLAVMERVEPVLLHIATIAARFAPEAQPWSYLLRHLPRRRSCPRMFYHTGPALSAKPASLHLGVARISNGFGVANRPYEQPASHFKNARPESHFACGDHTFRAFGTGVGLFLSHRVIFTTLKMDGILPLAWLQPPDVHQDFWQAVERTNVELEPDGLYLTHLFRELMSSYNRTGSTTVCGLTWVCEN